MPIGLLIQTLLGSFKGQEQSFVSAQLTTVVKEENNRVGAGLTDPDIASFVGLLCKLAFAEQTALVSLLTSRLGAK